MVLKNNNTEIQRKILITQRVEGESIIMPFATTEPSGLRFTIFLYSIGKISCFFKQVFQFEKEKKKKKA